MTRCFVRLLPGSLALALSVALPAAAQPKEPGDLWEVATEMSMAGMPAGMQMPQRPPQRICRARSSDTPPVGDNDGRCQMYDVQRSASSFAWKMRCQGNPPSTGTGEMTFEGRDGYKGTINMTVGGQSMTMKLTGKRVGDCDATEAKQQVAAVQQRAAAAQQQAADAFAAMCKGAVDSMMSQQLRPEAGYRCDAKYKADFCSRLQSPEGFAVVAPRHPSAVAGMPGGDLREASEFCGVNGDEIRLRLCKTADAQESVDFLASSCLGYARTTGLAGAKAGESFGSTIAARECAGRTFSSPPAQQYRAFCSAVARQNLMQPATADAATSNAGAATATADPPAEKKDDPAARAKKMLKDIFNR
ncbi:MAG TPA: DUF3617 family protein [Burkholderiaceae bacterium]|nr:DUF3617 family protein [Burkholderiaceae bacterium]